MISASPSPPGDASARTPSAPPARPDTTPPAAPASPGTGPSTPFRRLASADGKAVDPLAERRRLEEDEEKAHLALARIHEARAEHARRVREARDQVLLESVLRPLVREFAARVGEDEARIEAALVAITRSLEEKGAAARVLSQLGVPPKAAPRQN